MNRDQVLSLLRQVLTFGSGFIVAKGWVDNETAVGIVGALVVLISSGWSIVAHAGATKAQALDVATGTGSGKDVAAVEKTTGKIVPNT